MSAFKVSIRPRFLHIRKINYRFWITHTLCTIGKSGFRVPKTSALSYKNNTISRKELSVGPHRASVMLTYLKGDFILSYTMSLSFQKSKT